MPLVNAESYLGLQVYQQKVSLATLPLLGDTLPWVKDTVATLPLGMSFVSFTNNPSKGGDTVLQADKVESLLCRGVLSFVGDAISGAVPKEGDISSTEDVAREEGGIPSNTQDTEQ